MNRRSLLAMLGGLVGAAAAPAAPVVWRLDSATESVLGTTTVLATEPARLRPTLGYVPMPASAVIALTGDRDEMREIDITAHGVPARAAGVHLAGWARIERPGKLWAFSDASGQHGGTYHAREASVDWMFVPATRGLVCVMGSAPWGLDVRITGYWL